MTEYNCSLSSFLSLGAADGPKVRSVVFLQGCPLRCDYCHNPETWEFTKNNTNSDELLQKIKRNIPYFKDGGGVTISGGEPLCQPEFLIDFLKKLKELNIHTCIDTSAHSYTKDLKEILNYTDLVICDLKFANDEDYKKHAAGSFPKVIEFLDVLFALNKPVWIRHVVYPNVSDNEEYILKLCQIIKHYSNVEKFELLPFKNICSVKYENMGLEFKMKDVDPVSKETMEKLNKIKNQALN